MPRPSENVKLIEDYYGAFGEGGAEGLARMAAFYADDKTNYTAGNSEFSVTATSPSESSQILNRILELNAGNLGIVGKPVILLAGDSMVAVLLTEKHHRVGQPELVVPRLCIYEIADGKLGKSFIWNLESKAYDEYYPKP